MLTLAAMKATARATAGPTGIVAATEKTYVPQYTRRVRGPLE